MQKQIDLSTSRVFVIDGGFSTQLAKYVGSNIDGHALWSALFNVTNPTAVKQAHLDYLESGSQIILTNTYQASIEGFTQHLNMNRADSVALIKSTVKLAQDAREEFLQANKSCMVVPLIFASIGPYGAHLNDCSEYKGIYAANVTATTIQNWHKVRIEACIEAGVDGLAVETIPCQVCE